MGVRIGADTGGTHTDLVVIDDDAGAVTTLKVPTTPDDLSRGIAAGIQDVIRAANLGTSEVERFVYGTTLVTNLIVEEQHGAIGLITTAGFRDVLEIGRASRKPNIYDIHWRPPVPLISRDLRLTVPERVAHDGQVLVPLDETAVRAALATLAEAGAQSVAVCLLNAYANPMHERRIAAIAEAEFPALTISLSSEVAREFREYERTSTTAINAFVILPIIEHLEGLSRSLTDIGILPAPYIIRSNGGVMSFKSATRIPAALTHSGPMGGIVGGAALAAQAGHRKIVTLDMGGTTADVSLIVDGKADMTTRSAVNRHPLLLPMLDLIAIGAGGGSIAWVDVGGALRIGPRSAGSMPGPACYGQGGENPTVTDANLLAGRLNPQFFLAGKRELFPEQARAALRKMVVEPCGLTEAQAAMGILAIAEAHMVNAIKLISVQRGLDPREFTLVGFGGAGPLHTLRLAEELGMTQALIPPAPGNLSALGMLAAEVRHDLVRTRLSLLDSIDPAVLAADFDEMLRAGAKALEAEDVSGDAARFVMTVDLRYRGQNYDLNIPLPVGDMTAALEGLPARFHERHRAIFGYDNPAKPIQLVNLRLAATGPSPILPWPTVPAIKGAPRPVERRRVQLDASTNSELPVFRLTDLGADQLIEEPAIVEYPGSTLFMPPGWAARVDECRILHLSRAAGQA